MHTTDKRLIFNNKKTTLKNYKEIYQWTIRKYKLSIPLLIREMQIKMKM